MLKQWRMARGAKMDEEANKNACEASAAGNLEEIVQLQSDRIAALEAKLDNQEQSLRHVLGMLIEWMEEDPARVAA
jgi:hypothetical protein